MNTKNRADEQMVQRLSAYNLQKHDYIFAIALTSSILISMLRSFAETAEKRSGEETPEAIQQLIDDLEIMMHAMMRGSGSEHVSMGYEKSTVLFEELFRIVKSPSIRKQ